MPEPRARFKRVDLFFNPGEKKAFSIVLWAGAALLGLSLIAIPAAISLGGAFRPPPHPGNVGEKYGSTASAGGQPALSETGELQKSMSLSEFAIPDESQRILEPEFSPYRARKGKWDRETADRYWVPPSQMALEKLRTLNDKNIETLLEDVP